MNKASPPEQEPTPGGTESSLTSDDDSWTPPARHPPAGTIVQPSRNARLRTALLAAAMLVPSLALLPVLNSYQALGLAVLIEPTLLPELERVRGYLLLIFSGVVLVIWYLSYMLARLARNINQFGCYPPPGSRVLFPTELVIGRQCEMIRRFCNLSAVALVILAGMFFVALIRLYQESNALLEGLRLFIDSL